MCVVAACGESRSGGSAQRVAVGAPVPAYAAVSLAGDSVRLASLQGRVVLLNVWATWCYPCRDEIPELVQLHQRYGDRGLDIVGVSIDAAGSDDAIRDFMRDFGMTYAVWRDPGERVSSQFATIGVPVTFLIDRSGVLRWQKTGPIQPGDSTLTVALERALAG